LLQLSNKMKLLKFIFISISVILFVACGEGSPSYVSQNGIEYDVNKPGETYQFVDENGMITYINVDTSTDS